LPQELRPNQVFRFGVFELDAQTGDLSKNGKTCARLVGQPLALLLQLLETPGALVKREDLRKRLWPPDTFVDYEHSLNAAINKLREILNDSADNPRFIETIPRQGYRFIAPMQSATVEPARERRTQTTLEAGGTDRTAEPPDSVLSDPRELPSLLPRHSRMLFSLLQAMYLSFYVLALANLAGTDAALNRLFARSTAPLVLVIVTAAAGIPVRLYFLSAAVFGYKRLADRFQKLFPALFLLDELWGMAPFLIVERIGLGAALACTATLLFLPFSQRSVLLMGQRSLEDAS
jgi:DNA-binding winged helix-turn-helix (wHTH) protein